jgi:hypothetical protein
MPPYDTEILLKKAIQAIQDNNLIFVEDVCAFVGISKPTFYTHFKVGSDYFNQLSDLLEKNKINLKVSIRKKWLDSDRDTGLMALYKLCSTPEEHRKLQQNYVDHTSKGESIKMTPEEREAEIQRLKSKLSDDNG